MSHPVKPREPIRKGLVEALKKVDKFKSFKIKPPINLKVSFVNTGMADITELLPGTRRVDGRAISFSSEDLIEIYKTFRSMIMPGGTTV